MSRMRVLFGLQGAEVLARLRSWRLGDTSSTALSCGSRYVLKDVCQTGWTQANMSMTRVRFGLRGAEVLGLPFLGVLETLVALLFLSGGSRYVLKDVAR